MRRCVEAKARAAERVAASLAERVKSTMVVVMVVLMADVGADCAGRGEEAMIRRAGHAGGLERERRFQSGLLGGCCAWFALSGRL